MERKKKDLNDHMIPSGLISGQSYDSKLNASLALCLLDVYLG